MKTIPCRFPRKAVLYSQRGCASEPQKLTCIPHKIILHFVNIPAGHADRPFTPEQAAEVRRFVDGPGPKAKLYICCGGESISAAIAATTYIYLGKDEMTIRMDPRYHPNGLLYTLMCRVCGLSVTEELVSQPLKISREALRESITGWR